MHTPFLFENVERGVGPFFHAQSWQLKQISCNLMKPPVLNIGGGDMSPPSPTAIPIVSHILLYTNEQNKQLINDLCWFTQSHLPFMSWSERRAISDNIHTQHPRGKGMSYSNKVKYLYTILNDSKWNSRWENCLLMKEIVLEYKLKVIYERMMTDEECKKSQEL